MGLLQRLNDAFRREKPHAVQEIGQNSLRVSPLASNYENMFAQVRPLIDAMKMVVPYGVGRNGAKLPYNRTPELDLLIHNPNDDMSGMDFADAMFATWLTEPELDIHVWRNGNKIVGYSILPPNSRRRIAGENVYYVNNDGVQEVLHDDEVMVLRFSRLPRNIDHGLSLAGSVQYWTQIDDLMAQYQRAYLENGAVPASITFITASTREKYDAKRQALEMGLKGAINKNKTIYAWRQMLDDNSSADEVEVKTIQGNNSTLAIREIMDIVNDKLNKAVGVSNFILGDDSSAKYDNAELSDHQFTRRRVYPALVTFWNQLQFELDRITGGLGYGIQFELPMPDLTEQVAAKANINSTNANTLINLVTAGASPESVVDALGLNDSWLKVANGVKQQKLTSGEMAKPDPLIVVDARSVAPKQTLDAEEVTGEDNFEVKWEPGEDIAKAIYDELMKAAESIAKRENVDVDAVVAEIMRQLEISGAQGVADSVEAMADLVGKLVEGAKDAIEDGEWNLSEALVESLQARTRELVENFDDEVAVRVDEVLNTPGLTARETEQQLAAVMPQSRAQMIARNETVHAFRAGSMDNDRAIADAYDLSLKFEWVARHDAKTCPVCAAMNGTIVDAGQAFPDQIQLDDGEVVAWEHSHWNLDGQEPNAHPNCRCRYHRIVERRAND